ncbi:hypothetical protein KIH13_16560 [Pseudomonas viridiflava]|nr:hypothetical protein KIH13_16560 [Pseudomonas viridiflava]
MISSTDQYLNAARREGTQRRYRQDIEHFEAEWGGFLPASSENVVRYLAEHAELLTGGTLRTHLAALAHWHKNTAFLIPPKNLECVTSYVAFRQSIHGR